MQLGDDQVSDACSMRRSVFWSEQERTFLRALSLRFPALLALPNYPLDQIVELGRLREVVGDELWSYGRLCRLDAILVIPDEGDPVAAFELDSGQHDAPEPGDEMKDAILRLIGLPF